MQLVDYEFKYSGMENTNCAILKDAAKVYLNDENLKPSWVNHPAKYTEFYIKRRKNTLLLNIGESWTYGETLPGIATAIQNYSFYSQLEHSFGPKLAVTLNSDLYQYAVPGNCNFYMFKELKRILEYVAGQGYRKIYVCLQMTEPGREQAITNQLLDDGHPVHNLYNLSNKINFKTWLETYDNIFLNQLEQTIKPYLNLDVVVWKNFCRFLAPVEGRQFKTVDTSWIQYSGRILGEELEMPSFYSVGWLATMKDILGKYIVFDHEFVNRELDIIERSNNFIRVNPLHSNHPNQYAHTLWAQFLARKSGWVNGI